MPDLHATWERLTNVAIAGLARQDLPAIDADDAPGRFCAGIACEEKPAQFLNIAGTVAVCRLAGALPVQDAADALAPSPPDARSCCSSEAARLLRLLLTESHLAQVLPEWIALATRRQWLIPPELLSTVLPAMAKSANLRQDLQPLIGERGRWLARLNPEWRACVPAETDASCREIWETGNRAERVAALRALRALDPAGARALLDESRASEPLDTLAALIPALEVNLSPDDEPLLEALLDDKRKTIRRPVADLLARLPGAGYGRRMTERAGAWLAITPARAGTLFPPRAKQPLKLEVALPEKFAAEWARDAIEETPPPGTGAKSWWLQQMLAAVPLGHWEVAGQCAARDLVAAVRASEHNKALLHGWLLAAQRQRNISWMVALLHCGDADIMHPIAGEAIRALSPAEREQVLAALMTDNAKNVAVIIASLLSVCTDPWSEDFSRLVVNFQPESNLRVFFETLAYCLHPRYLESCRRQFALIATDGQAAFDARVRAVMQFRAELYHACEESI